jgi:hypothetical protein
MEKTIRFIPKSELERARLIREARAIYDSIFPPTDPLSAQPDRRQPPGAQPGTRASIRPIARS